MNCIKNKKLAIYPYNPDFATVLRRSEIRNDSNGIIVVAPPGLGLQGKDSGEVDGGSSVGINITDNFESCLEEIDTAIFLDCKVEKSESFYNSLYKSAQMKKDIVLLGKIDDTVDKDIQTITNQNSSYYAKYFHINTAPYTEVYAGGASAAELQKIDVPVITIMGLSEYSNKFDVSMSLYQEIQKAGYKVSFIGSRSYCEFLGFHSFPEFMLDDMISGERKIRSFNNYVKSIGREENPDVILMTIPGGVIPFNDRIGNGYGILAYEVSRAVKPDISVLCTPYEEYNADFFNHILPMLKHRFEFEPDFINVSNIRILWNENKYTDNISYLRLSSSKVDEIVNKLKDTVGLPAFNSLNNSSPQQIANGILDKLQSNLYVV